MWMYFVFFIVFVLLIFATRKRQNELSEIPGPPGIPVFGNLFQLDIATSHFIVEEWAKKFGNVFKMQLFRTEIVVVSGKEALYELLVKNGQAFSGRILTPRFKKFSVNYNDIAFSDPTGENWSKLKKHALKHIRAYGSGFKFIEKVTLENMSSTITRIKEMDSREVDVLWFLEKTLIGIMYNMLFGINAKNEEEDCVIEWGNMLNPVLNPGGVGEFIDLFPWLKYFNFKPWEVLCDAERKMWGQFSEWKKRAREESRDGINIIKSFLEVQKEGLYKVTDENMMIVTFQLFYAGIMTTSGTLAALIHILSDREDVQLKLHEESKAILGNDDVKFEDRYRMHYHQAVLFEATRLVPVQPFLIAHKALHDTTLAGYKIPKDTQVWPNIWELHHREDIFKDAYQFQPERYLDEEGKLLPADHPYRVCHLTFGAGPRVCVGETFAMARMFIMIAQMMKHFTIVRPEGQKPYDIRKMQNGIAMRPEPFKVKFMPRK